MIVNAVELARGNKILYARSRFYWRFKNCGSKTLVYTGMRLCDLMSLHERKDKIQRNMAAQ